MQKTKVKIKCYDPDTYNGALYFHIDGYLIDGVPGLVVNRSIDTIENNKPQIGNKWSLTHAKSGIRVGGSGFQFFKTRKAAVKFAHAIAKVDWTKDMDDITVDDRYIVVNTAKEFFPDSFS
jgi:hypothetical protein